MMHEGVDLDGRAVAITGAGNGLGRAYAVAASAAGARVVACDIDEKAASRTVDQISAAGGTAIALTDDISEPGAGTRIAAVATRAFGGLDGFVANAGLLSHGPLLAQSESAIRRTTAVNVDGTIETVAAAARAMRSGGSIVVVSSGSLLGSENLALYGATKAAALGLVYGLAVELDGTGIRINGLAPRARTGMSAQMGDAGEDKGGPPEAIAPVVTYLLSDASRGLNGQLLRFDGVRLGLFRPPRIAREAIAERWDAETIAAAIAGPLGEEVQKTRPGVARRTGDRVDIVLDVDTAHSSSCLGAEGDR